ncbi:nime/cyclinb [Mycena leptocephala]|nr:nime/cyclinb [Mycena leptocephala]
MEALADAEEDEQPDDGPTLAGLAAKGASGSTDEVARVASGKTSKRKREALREPPRLRNGSVVKGDRKILGLPMNSNTAMRHTLHPVTDENARRPVFVALPATRISNAPHLRSSNAAVQREKRVHADDDEPILKRQLMSSVDPEDVAAVAYRDKAEPEATPDGDLWEDLEAADFDDPTMASEYVTDIQRYLRDVERNTMPNPNYMDSQPKLTWEMRAVLVDWLIQVHTRFRLTPETLFLCTNLIDRFLSARAISPSRLQPVGMVCLLIASKVEETISPAITNFILVCNGAYTCAKMLQAEQRILRALDWDLSHREIACVEHRLLPSLPSLVAAAAMWLARIALGEEAWTPTFAHYAMYAESTLIPVAAHMLYYVLRPIRHDSLYKKYAEKRNMKASVYMRQWALARWAEGTMPHLAADLPGVNNEIRVQKRLRALRNAQ